MQLPISPS